MTLTQDCDNHMTKPYQKCIFCAFFAYRQLYIAAMQQSVTV